MININIKTAVMENKEQYQRDVIDYLNEKQVYSKFEYMLRELTNEMPEDPIEFLLHLLSKSSHPS